ncbi:hypothetical protein D623_10030171 [Myotis brandtii]|uniref:Uncharacterized protein n=1 Tax=Myotis brandtii TaxID=109478 RepID=S7MDA1_MYOBR|nr:hypothetical protein D623_10030171 [Myotis brandtii]
MRALTMCQAECPAVLTVFTSHDLLRAQSTLLGGLFLPHVDGLHVLLLKELAQLKMACLVLLSPLPCQGSALLQNPFLASLDRRRREERRSEPRCLTGFRREVPELRENQTNTARTFSSKAALRQPPSTTLFQHRIKPRLFPLLKSRFCFAHFSRLHSRFI